MGLKNVTNLTGYDTKKKVYKKNLLGTKNSQYKYKSWEPIPTTYIFEIANPTLLESLGVIILSKQNSTLWSKSPIGTYMVISY
jgi:hypothetical protein